MTKTLAQFVSPNDPDNATINEAKAVKAFSDACNIPTGAIVAIQPSSTLGAVQIGMDQLATWGANPDTDRVNLYLRKPGTTDDDPSADEESVGLTIQELKGKDALTAALALNAFRHPGSNGAALLSSPIVSAAIAGALAPYKRF